MQNIINMDEVRRIGYFSALSFLVFLFVSVVSLIALAPCFFANKVAGPREIVLGRFLFFSTIGLLVNTAIFTRFFRNREFDPTPLSTAAMIITTVALFWLDS